MRRLPPHHVPRPRLTDRCANYQVIVVEAAGGYGKTVLGTELVDRWRAVGIDVQVEHEGMTAPLLAARLRAAAQHAGFTEAAAAAAGPGDDAFGAVDALVRALAGEPCAFVIDDAHHARPDAGALIDHIASRLEAEHRLVVLARQLPQGAERLRRAENLHLTSADLAMTPDETLELCRSGFELKIGPHTAKVLDRATGGWTAATVLAAARAARTGEALGDMAEAAIGPGHPTEAVAAILDEAVVALGPSSRRGLAQVARLPLLDAGLVDLAAGEEGFFERSLSAGIPYTPARGPWWDLPGPVRDYLATFSPLSADAMRLAAKEYGRRGELEWALHLLLASGDAGEAASMLAATPPEVVETMDALELGAVFDQLPAEAVDAHPNMLLVVARACRLATRFDQGAVLLERAGALAARAGDSALERAIAAEVAHDLLRELRHGEVEETARRVLDEVGPGEQLTRARAYHALGQALCWRVDGSGRRDEAALAEAEEYFTRATNLYRAQGMRSAVSALAPYWALMIEFAGGRAQAAMDRLEKALTLVSDRPRRWAYVMCFRAWVAPGGDRARATSWPTPPTCWTGSGTPPWRGSTWPG